MFLSWSLTRKKRLGFFLFLFLSVHIGISRFLASIHIIAGSGLKKESPGNLPSLYLSELSYVLHTKYLVVLGRENKEKCIHSIFPGVEIFPGFFWLVLACVMSFFIVLFLNPFVSLYVTCFTYWKYIVRSYLFFSIQFDN